MTGKGGVRVATELRPRRVRRAGAALAATALLLAACTSPADEPEPDPSPAPPASPQAATAAAGEVRHGYSEPVEDAVYPEVGDPGVDALHYDLALTWDPDRSRLAGRETVTFRATADDEGFQLDLAEQLTVGSVRVDGAEVEFEHDGKDLLIDHPVTADREYTLTLRYAGTPQPVAAPVQRSDFSSTGWTTTPEGEVWTMQEPYGAFTWYAVNDQPSDKARYDITVRVPPPMVGVANGRLLSQRTVGGLSVSRWRLTEPAASYLVTVAIGEFEVTRDRSPSGVPISYWVPPGRDDLVRRLGEAPEALAWLEERLGPYPYDTLGFVVVDSLSGMETQTMITLGDTAYATSPQVIVHEIAHHWYGDAVTPVDWRDMWMNEGMAMYLQAVWDSEHGGPPLAATMARWAALDAEQRADAGPPAAFDADSFGSPNVYYIPAVMWDRLRQRLGDEEFWPLVRAWPEQRDNANADYADITGWWSEQTGEDLSGFFEDWLLDDEPPAASAVG